ncbi:hypothetical protein RRG08_056486 [Elysia crispata]|uniref:Uncharacterized protein n=1 Tax=Elysia crispata TaxID=231223 RepID=A0AAE1CKW7_9GAST|nr:hypothetical protein RRG08_056486 [Elysia crispata]
MADTNGRSTNLRELLTQDINLRASKIEHCTEEMIRAQMPCCPRRLSVIFGDWSVLNAPWLKAVLSWFGLFGEVTSHAPVLFPHRRPRRLKMFWKMIRHAIVLSPLVVNAGAFTVRD